MNGDRRRFMRLAAAGMLAVVSVHARAAGPSFAPPATAMRYTRSLRRELSDGAAIVATRVFTVRFVPVPAGYRVEGDESAPPEVVAPPSLEPFARLERERRETSVFPLTLDREGRIVDEPATAGSPQLAQAVDEALHRIAASDRAADEQAAMRAFVLGLEQAAGSLLAVLPADLFHPVTAPLSETRAVRLPDGGNGEIALRFTAGMDPATGLMEEAERVVLTRLDGSERRTLERWTLGPA